MSDAVPTRRAAVAADAATSTSAPIRRQRRAPSRELAAPAERWPPVEGATRTGTAPIARRGGARAVGRRRWLGASSLEPTPSSSARPGIGAERRLRVAVRPRRDLRASRRRGSTWLSTSASRAVARAVEASSRPRRPTPPRRRSSPPACTSTSTPASPRRRAAGRLGRPRGARRRAAAPGASCGFTRLGRTSPTPPDDDDAASARLPTEASSVPRSSARVSRSGTCAVELGGLDRPELRLRHGALAASNSLRIPVTTTASRPPTSGSAR